MKSEEIRESKKSSSKDFFMGALLGGIAGAATAIYLASKSGKDIRTILNGQTHYLKEKKDLIRNSINKVNLSKNLQLNDEIKSDQEFIEIPFSSEDIHKKLAEAQKAFDEEEQRITLS